jgi:hypothetical protein
VDVWEDEDVTRPPSPTTRSVILDCTVVRQVDTTLIVSVDAAFSSWVRLGAVAVIVSATKFLVAE